MISCLLLPALGSGQQETLEKTYYEKCLQIGHRQFQDSLQGILRFFSRSDGGTFNGLNERTMTYDVAEIIF